MPWPAQVLWVLGFKPGDSCENGDFRKNRANVTFELPGWDSLVMGPGHAASLVAALPEDARASVATALGLASTRWVERNDLVRGLALHKHGGLVLDGIDCAVVSGKGAEVDKWRYVDLLLVNGNDAAQLMEPDIVGAYPGDPC